MANLKVVNWQRIDLKQMRAVGVLIEFSKQLLRVSYPIVTLASAATWSPPCRSCDIANAVASSNVYAILGIDAVTEENDRGALSKNVSRDLQYSLLFANKVCLFLLLSRSIPTPHTPSATRLRFPRYRPPSTMLLDLSLHSASAARPVYRRTMQARQHDSDTCHPSLYTTTMVEYSLLVLRAERLSIRQPPEFYVTVADGSRKESESSVARGATPMWNFKSKIKF
ncbi:hypothetical protein K438DRAFT_1991191 [Mycena galopus ATCC 62051]|nr:hypothetical protein K438DRAFT_1991191 [Mycena galopus ATCC 62051]